MDKVFYSVCGCKTETFFFVPLRDPFVILAEMIYICGAEYNLEGFMSFDIVMGKRYIAISCLMLLFLAACGENGDKSVSPEDEPVSEENSSSSSSVKLSSSSSVILSTNEEYSSSLVKSSCSAAVNSSSSVTLATPCKTDSTDTCEYGELIDDRDGRTYKTVKIGDQWWMAENLNYADSVKTPSLLKRNWCYNNEPDSCSKYGRLYTWTAAIDSVKIATDSERPCFCSSEWLCYNSDRRKCVLPDTVPGICPSGWHLPHYREWDVLMEAVGGESSGDVLRSQSGWYSNGDWYDDKGLDSFGFNALPAGEGYCSLDSCYFDRVVTHAHFWTSVEIPSHSHEANLMNLWYPRREGWIIGEPKDFGHSIRCVKD